MRMNDETIDKMSAAITIASRPGWREQSCARCGARFGCGASAGPQQPRCWCADLPALSLAQIQSEAAPQTCLCPNCLSEKLRALDQPRPDHEPA